MPVDLLHLGVEIVVFLLAGLVEGLALFGGGVHQLIHARGLRLARGLERGDLLRNGLLRHRLGLLGLHGFAGCRDAGLDGSRSVLLVA